MNSHVKSKFHSSFTIFFDGLGNFLFGSHPFFHRFFTVIFSFLFYIYFAKFACSSDFYNLADFSFLANLWLVNLIFSAVYCLTSFFKRDSSIFYLFSCLHEFQLLFLVLIVLVSCFFALVLHKPYAYKDTLVVQDLQTISVSSESFGWDSGVKVVIPDGLAEPYNLISDSGVLGKDEFVSDITLVKAKISDAVTVNTKASPEILMSHSKVKLNESDFPIGGYLSSAEPDIVYFVIYTDVSELSSDDLGCLLAKYLSLESSLNFGFSGFSSLLVFLMTLVCVFVFDIAFYFDYMLNYFDDSILI